MIHIINQLFEIEQKLKNRLETGTERNFKRLYHELEQLGYQVIDPIGRPYKETDTDLEATLSGDLRGELKITRVLKPVIYYREAGAFTQLMQKGIVIIEGVN